ncbi:MAG: hypothetical protein CMD18_01695, partial [Flavobacteriales bacterium]|nr:hypothetical protein [Flavobacteriales bacterium]
PNPSSEFLFIRSNKRVNTISIKNILGKEIMSKKFESDQELFEIDISNLSTGIYLINVADAYGKNIQSKKVFIK